KIKWDIVAVQEARIVGLASFNLAASGIVVYHSGGATARHGVAFLLQPHLAKGAVFRGLSDRLATLQLPQQKLFLVNAYAPTSAYDDAVYDDFLDQIENALHDAPAGYMPVLVGDFNCRVAKEPGNERFVGEFASPTPNSRGRSFAETCVRNKLRIQNTFPKRRRGRIWTWRSPNHRLVRLTLSLPNKVRHKRCRERLDFDKVAFAANANLLASMPLARPSSATDAFHKIQAFAKTAATNCWRKRQSPPWISPATRKLLAQRHLLRSSLQSNVEYSLSCKTARSNLVDDIKRSKAARTSFVDDIRKRKEAQARQAATMGRSIVKSMLSLQTSKKRLLVPHPVTGALSQAATKTVVQSFFDGLYTPAVPCPLPVPPQPLDPLPPFLPDELFNAVLRSAMDNIDWESDGIRIDGRNLCHLEYADDVALVAKSRPELERMLKKLMDACSRVGLEVNASKTNLLTSCTSTRNPIIIGNLRFEFVDSATYLGGRIALPLDHSDEIEHRIRLEWLAWSKLSHLLSSRILSIKIRRRVFESCITATVLYGCEVWALRSSEKERLRVTQRKMERKMLGVTLRDRWRN
ncbi:hypothetical protein PMAYCL1PPCAC_05406, partial [Pristionchus mayeri]